MTSEEEVRKYLAGGETAAPPEKRLGPGKVYEKNGRRVYDSANADPGGTTRPTHVVDSIAKRLQNGETVEQLEQRVLAHNDFTNDTLPSANENTLRPDTRANADQLIAAAAHDGVHLSVGETRRSQERQDWLFQSGRSRPGPIVTWTLTSDHEPGDALDLHSDDPKGYAWLQEHAPKFGFRSMGAMDPGHIASARAATPPRAPVPTTPPARPERYRPSISERLQSGVIDALEGAGEGAVDFSYRQLQNLVGLEGGAAKVAGAVAGAARLHGISDALKTYGRRADVSRYAIQQKRESEMRKNPTDSKIETAANIGANLALEGAKYVGGGGLIRGGAAAVGARLGIGAALGAGAEAVAAGESTAASAGAGGRAVSMLSRARGALNHLGMEAVKDAAAVAPIDALTVAGGPQESMAGTYGAMSDVHQAETGRGLPGGETAKRLAANPITRLGTEMAAGLGADLVLRSAGSALKWSHNLNKAPSIAEAIRDGLHDVDPAAAAPGDMAAREAYRDAAGQLPLEDKTTEGVRADLALNLDHLVQRRFDEAEVASNNTARIRGNVDAALARVQQLHGEADHALYLDELRTLESAPQTPYSPLLPPGEAGQQRALEGSRVRQPEPVPVQSMDAPLPSQADVAMARTQQAQALVESVDASKQFERQQAEAKMIAEQQAQQAEKQAVQDRLDRAAASAAAARDKQPIVLRSIAAPASYATGEALDDQDNEYRHDLALALKGAGVVGMLMAARHLRPELDSYAVKRLAKIVEKNGEKGNPYARNLAIEYENANRGELGLNITRSRAKKLDPEFSKRVADYYDHAVSTADDPATQAAYAQMATETKRQYDFLKDKGIDFVFVKKDPYKNSAEMMLDVMENRRLKVLKTPEDAFHPLLTPEENDMFRAVHDYFGHAVEGHQFGPLGEENAYREHSAMFSPVARRAMATETRGQNSWVNFGPFGEANRANPAETKFAEQKVFLMPDELVFTGAPKQGVDVKFPTMDDLKAFDSPRMQEAMGRLRERMATSATPAGVGAAPGESSQATRASLEVGGRSFEGDTPEEALKAARAAGVSVRTKDAERLTKTVESPVATLARTTVRDDNGPIIVYRGEHGEGGGSGVQSRLGSISFGDRDAANLYAVDPNHHGDVPHSPRVTPAYLDVRNPFLNDPKEPFVSFKMVSEKLGPEKARELALKLADHIEGTPYWDDNWGEEFDSVADLLKAKPDAINDMDIEAFHFFDDPDAVKAMKAAGYDGAIHEGYGDTSGSVEYKVFDEKQIHPVYGPKGVGGVTLYSTPIVPAIKAAATRAGTSAALAGLGLSLESTDNKKLQATGAGLIGLAALHAIGTKRAAEFAGSIGKDVVERLRKTDWGYKAVLATNPDALLPPELKEGLQALRETVAKGEARAAEFAGKAQKLGPQGDRIVSDILEGENWEKDTPDNIEGVFQVAGELAAELTDWSMAKVEAGILSPATFDHYHDGAERAHLPRKYAYWEAMDALGERRAAGEGRKVRVEPDKKRTLDEPLREAQLRGAPQEEIDALTAERDAKRLSLGEIREASYRVRQGIAKSARQVAAAEFLKLAKNIPGTLHPEWERSLDEFLTAKTMYEEATSPADMNEARQLLDETRRNMQDVSRKYVGKAKGEYVVLPDNKSLGVLRGAVVTREVANAVNGMPEMGAIGRATKWWKKIHTVYNMGTHVGNTLSNPVAAHMGGLHLTSQPYYVTQAVKDMKRYGEATRAVTEAGDMNLNVVFSGEAGLSTRPKSAEALGELKATTRPETAAVLAEQGIPDTPEGMKAEVIRMLKAGDERVTKLYNNEDNVFRVAMYKWGRQQGMSEKEAIVHMRNSLGDYHTNSPALRALSATVVPFIMYQAKVMPKVAKNIVEHPWRWISLAASWALVDMASAAHEGPIDQSDVAPRDRTSKIMGYLMPGMTQLPFSGPGGDKVAFDISRWTPFSAMTSGAAPGAMGSQISDEWPAALTPSGPAVDLAVRSYGLDPYTGEREVGERHGVKGTAKFVAKSVASTALPSMLAFHLPRVVEDVENANYAAAATDALGFLGAKPRYVERGANVRNATFKMGQQMAEAKKELTRNLKRVQGTNARAMERRQGIIDEYQAQVIRINKRFQSRVDPN